MEVSAWGLIAMMKRGGGGEVPFHWTLGFRNGVKDHLPGMLNWIFVFLFSVNGVKRVKFEISGISIVSMGVM